MRSPLRLQSFDPYRGRNQDNRQQRNIAATKEGVIVNNLIKTNECALNDSFMINLPQNTYMPSDLYTRKREKPDRILSNPIIPMVAAPLFILGAGAGISKLFKNLVQAKNLIPEKDQLRNIGRIITINDDNNMVLYLLTQSPSKKSLLAAAGVLAASATIFVLKNALDGFKEIWVRKQRADIKRDLEENLIEIEKRSFSGKNQILRNIIAESAIQLEALRNSVSFTGYDRGTFSAFMKPTSFKNAPNEKKGVQNTRWFLPALAILTLGASGMFIRTIFKNLSSIGKHMEQVTAEAKNIIRKELANVSEADLQKNLAKADYSQELKTAVYKEWRTANGQDSVFETAPELMGGKDNKVSFISAVRDITAFLYTYIVNPTPQTRNLMMLVFANAGLGYIGKTAVEAVKEVQVEKANAKTELDLQDRLVQVELKNFMEKKKSYVQPIIDDFRQQVLKPHSSDTLKQAEENALYEIKVGPPFVYS